LFLGVLAREPLVVDGYDHLADDCCTSRQRCSLRELRQQLEQLPPGMLALRDLAVRLTADDWLNKAAVRACRLDITGCIRALAQLPLRHAALEILKLRACLQLGIDWLP
jgi:hypothetical protein